jgi:hypothetical protein
MISSLQRLLAAMMLLCSPAVFAQTNFWSDVPESAAKAVAGKRTIEPNKFRTVSLESAGFRQVLDAAPSEFSKAAKEQPSIILLPMPDGSSQRFALTRYSMMEPGLQAKFPDIQTYSIQGLDDPGATGKLDWTAFGFHAMILSASKGSVWIDPYSRGNTTHYMSYYKKDLDPKAFREEGLLDDGITVSQARIEGGPCLAAQLRSYRLAVACTGEYAVAVGGTSAALLHSAIVTTVNRVNGVYEQEVAIRLVLIASNNLVEFLDASTDPFTGNNSATTLINESQTVMNNFIGSANYDIGHTFSTGGGGLAQLGCVCTASKARGITGSTFPFGDAYDIDYVAHEMGHQFGGQHTFNATTGNCSGNGSSSSNTEPGSGTTIMAYAGICTTNDVQPHSDPQFQGISFDQIGTFSRSGSGNTCGTVINTGNTAPVVNAGSNYTIPINTPFRLIGSATDADGDALTYSWEQMDTGGPFGDWNAPSGAAPLFRSFVPSSTPVRYLPRLSDVANNVTTIGEIKPSYARTMKFRLTARDNKASGGGICYGEMTVTTSGATAFTVTSQTTATAWTANGSNTATITWNVAGTTGAPFNVANVDILLSVDGGLSFPYTLLSNTANDGTQSITIPSVPTSKGRIMVRSVGNIFYAMNSGTISITSACSAEGAEVAPAASVTAPAGNAALNLGLSPQYSAAVSPSGTIVASDPTSSLAIFYTVSGACQTFANTTQYKTLTFMPSISATYTFTISGAFPVIMNLYATSFDPINPCTNFLKSNGSYNGTTVSVGATVTQALTAGSTYVLMFSSFSSTQPTLPAAYSVTVSSASPAGGVIYAGSTLYNNPGAGFSYAYVVVNNATGNIVSIGASSNLSNSAAYPAGSYTVYGLNYANSIANLNSYVGGSFAALATNIFTNPGAFCANLSKNSVAVTILSGTSPVDFLGLTARKNGRVSELAWKTASETNTHHFNVLRSADGIRFTQKIGEVAAAGNSQSIRSYAFTDRTPAGKWNYYRIESVDLDGTLKQSNTAAVQFDGTSNTIFLYPNPAQKEITLDMMLSEAGTVQFRIYDHKGSSVGQWQKMVREGRNFIQLPVGHLANGVYVLRYQLANGEENQVRFMKSE